LAWPEAPRVEEEVPPRAALPQPAEPQVGVVQAQQVPYLSLWLERLAA